MKRITTGIVAAIIFSSISFAEPENFLGRAYRNCRALLVSSLHLESKPLRAKADKLHRMAISGLVAHNETISPLASILFNQSDAKFFFKVENGKVQHTIVFVPPEATPILDLLNAGIESIQKEALELNRKHPDVGNSFALSTQSWDDPKTRKFWEKCVADPIAGICALGSALGFAVTMNHLRVGENGFAFDSVTLTLAAGAGVLLAGAFNLSERYNEFIRKHYRFLHQSELEKASATMEVELRRHKLQSLLKQLTDLANTEHGKFVAYIVATKEEVDPQVMRFVFAGRFNAWTYSKGASQTLLDAGYVDLDEAKKIIKSSAPEQGVTPEDFFPSLPGSSAEEAN